MTPAIVLGALACVAFFLARGAVALLAQAGLGSRPLPALLDRAPASAVAREASADGVLRRNIFDSARGSLLAGPADPPGPAPDRPVTACDGELRLRATVFEPANPEGSIAAIFDASGIGRLYRTGHVVGGRTLVAIGSESVLLEGEGESCRVRMFGTDGEPADSAGRRSEPAEGEAITALAEDRFRVSRALVREAVSSPATALGAARVVMAHQDGRREPRLYGVRDGSVLARIGLRNGDVLHSLGEHDLSEPDGILAAYAEIERARRLSLTIVRDGRLRTLEYAFGP